MQKLVRDLFSVDKKETSEEERNNLIGRYGTTDLLNPLVCFCCTYIYLKARFLSQNKNDDDNEIIYIHHHSVSCILIYVIYFDLLYKK